ncbi:MAG: hypothetical protein NC816_03220 [Candidatus Omnitrophica bacterium]|nr:hypothetical protein [Candidatus Omnitrophota bacterium]
MNILAIGAHPDDLEILCGWTLTKYSKKGIKFLWLIFVMGIWVEKIYHLKNLLKLGIKKQKSSKYYRCRGFRTNCR